MIIYTAKLIKSKSQEIKKLQQENKELRRKVAHYEGIKQARKILGQRII